MKYMVILRASDEAMKAAQEVDFNEILDSMGRYNAELINAGVLVAAEGLDDAKNGVVVDYSSQPPVATDGPYGETKELFGGFWILDVASQEEAVEWAKRVPLGPGYEDRGPAGVEHRRVPAGQRVDPEGAGVAGVDRPAVSPDAGPPGARTRVARRSRPCGGSSRRGSSARSPATPATSRWPRTSPRRHSPRHGLVAARRRTPQPGRLAAHRRPASRHRRLPAALGSR